MNWIMYIAFIFLLYSFLGWCLEQVYCFLITKHFKEDGFLAGPFKPMYGFAIAIMVYLFEVTKIQGILLLIAIIIVPTAIEYLSGYILRVKFNKDYWDYSNVKYNYKGLICARFSLYWAILTSVVLYIIQPIVNSIYFRFNSVFKFIVPILMIYIILDFYGTVKLMNLNKA